MRYLYCILALLPLAACEREDRLAVTDQVKADADSAAEQAKIDALTGTDKVEEEGKKLGKKLQGEGKTLARRARDNVKLTAEQLREWVIEPPPPKPIPRPVTTSYCYTVLHDILCYRQPMPGWESRLVAYQGTYAKVPPAAVTEPLPVHASDASATPESRIANSKPVFVTAPEPPKEDEKNPDVPPVVDATHEQLPNPTLSPQL